ncbi:hypothetical protein HIM_06831 [Hirsutella minnesotensis 3608]|uniref:LysM domain-containing protein n=1 Tax=Hirsutella minnesotensis 3608 TaxID=1043627 RepID=A0A0F7ZTU3_9HYPO|nr:hypothetical protein HIM_06831 [Hirsutella minnesotensis 3608]
MISLGRILLALGAAEVAFAGIAGTRTVYRRDDKDFTPRQPGIVAECTKFYMVQPGDTCYKVALEQNISPVDFANWNTKVGPNCEYLLAGYYACVSVTQPTPVQPTPVDPTPIGPTPIGPTPIGPTPIQPTPVQTPQPIQNGMVSNCNKFYLVKPGQACYDVAAQTGVSVNDLIRWNPAVGKDCTNMWAYYNVCVGVAS